jgi:flagella basal body P-ring formation protein FlgA
MIAAAVRRGAGSRRLALAAVLVAAVTVPALALAANIDLPVPRTTIYPGDVISADQIMDRAFIAHTVTRSSIFDNRDALIGKVARRTLLPGQPVPVNAIRDAYLVSQGKSSIVVFESGGLSITMHAVALDNGVAGDIVKLRNPDSGVIIQGTVERDGSVRLGAP